MCVLLRYFDNYEFEWCVAMCSQSYASDVTDEMCANFRHGIKIEKVKLQFRQALRESRVRN